MRSPAARRTARPSSGEWTMLVLLAAWAAIPIVLNLGHAARIGGHWTGAEGPFAPDQLAYMAWIRDEGRHLLAGDLMDTAASAHVYLNPMLLLSGLVWRLGVSVPLSFLAWKPAVLLVLFAGAALYVRRLLEGAGERLAALAIGLFYFAPIVPLLWWLGLIGGRERDRLASPAGQLFAAGQEWGYLLAGASIGLVALSLLTAERALRPRPATDRHRSLAWASLGALLAGWLHPWQGFTLALILGGLIVWGRGWRERLTLAWPLAAALAPVAYYFVLSRADRAWHYGALQNELPRYGLDALAVTLAPLLIAAALGVRWRRVARPDFQERALLLWPLAGLLVYFVLVPSFPGHGLLGLAIPGGVLAARGARRVGTHRLLAVAAAGALTVPGVVFAVERYRDVVRDGTQGGTLTSGEDAAMRWLARDPDRGAVLAPTLIGAVVPVETGRQTWVGHASMTPHYYQRTVTAELLFDGRLASTAAQAVVRGAHVRFLLADCRGRADLTLSLGTMLAGVRRFGCAAVYRLR